MDLMITLLSMVAVRLPVLIALAVSLVWVVDTPRGTVRTVALWALSLLAAATVVGTLVNLVPMWMVDRGNFTAVESLAMWLGVAHFVLGLVEALGLVLLVWAMTRALRALKGSAAG